jgi:predicted nucleic acid-binding protein
MLARTAWLPAVAAAELFCGARTVEQARATQRLYDMFDRRARVLTSTADEYVRAGKLISRAIGLRGAMEPRDHLNDVLITLIAHRLGARIATENRADFEGWIALGNLSAALLL